MFINLGVFWVGAHFSCTTKILQKSVVIFAYPVCTTVMCICHRGHRTPKNLNNNRETGQENHGSTPFGENISKDGGPGPGYKNHNVTRNKTKIRQLAINVLPVQKTIYLSKMQNIGWGILPHMPCICRPFPISALLDHLTKVVNTHVRRVGAINQSFQDSGPRVT